MILLIFCFFCRTQICWWGNHASRLYQRLSYLREQTRLILQLMRLERSQEVSLFNSPTPILSHTPYKKQRWLFPICPSCNIYQSHRSPFPSPYHPQHIPHIHPRKGTFFDTSPFPAPSSFMSCIRKGQVIYGIHG